MTRIVRRTRYPNRIILKERKTKLTISVKLFTPQPYIGFRQNSFTYCVCTKSHPKLFEGRGFQRIAEEMLHHLSGLNPAAAATKQRKVISQKRPASLPTPEEEKNMSRIPRHIPRQPYIPSFSHQLIKVCSTGGKAHKIPFSPSLLRYINHPFCFLSFSSKLQTHVPTHAK